MSFLNSDIKRIDQEETQIGIKNNVIVQNERLPSTGYTLSKRWMLHSLRPNIEAQLFFLQKIVSKFIFHCIKSKIYNNSQDMNKSLMSLTDVIGGCHYKKLDLWLQPRPAVKSKSMRAYEIQVQSANTEDRDKV